MRKLYCCNPQSYDTHFVQKGGGFPIYVGSGIQRGHGIGGIFAGLAKMAVPLLKSAAKSAGKTLLRTGAQFAGDLIQGKNVKDAAKQRAMEAGKSIGRNVLSSVQGLAGARNVDNNNTNKKRKASASRSIPRSAKRRKGSRTSSSNDIFG